jgi:two-component system sensor histidine kinase BaeS
VGVAIESVMGTLEEDAKRRSVRVRRDVEEDAVIEADGNMFHLVAHSLIHNAIRFSRSPGDVAVEARREGPEVVLVVTDQGSGIDASYLPYVFDEFVPYDIAHHGDGHGLSLALCREIIRQHGGQIGVQSDPDKQTRFTVRWPAASRARVSQD